MQRALFYAKHIDRFASPKHNLFVFQVRTNKARDQGVLGSRCPNSRQLQHSCSSLAAVLLTCLKDIAQTYPFILVIAFLKYVLLSYFYHSKTHGLRTRCIQPLRKEAKTLSTLQGLANCVKNRTRKMYPPTERLACCSVADTYFRSCLRILFTGFLETKAQIQKLM